MSYRPICDLWWLARCKYKGGVKRYGGYLGGFPERARVLLGASIADPVLHVCGGLARLYPYEGGYGPNDETLDLDPDVKPDHEQDARDEFPSSPKWLVQIGRREVPEKVYWRAILIDPPYSEVDAKNYAPGAAAYPSPNVLIKNALDVLPIGGRVGLIHFVVPANQKPRAKFVASVGICCGFNNRIRAFTVFEKIAK